jgi:lipopolysaccharide transport system permease protein
MLSPPRVSLIPNQREPDVPSADLAPQPPAIAAEVPKLSSHAVALERDLPVVRIDSARHWSAASLRELWTYRELFYFLIWRDVKIRYKQTVLGALWAVLQPLATTLVFTVIFGRLAKLPSDGVAYPVFAFSGLLPWLFLANTTSTGGNSLVNNAALISKVYFPRIAVPSAAIGTGLLDFVIASGILAGMMVFYGVVPTYRILFIPLITVLLCALALSLAFWFSALTVKFRDVRYVLPFLVQLWMFATPVIYPSSMLTGDWRLLLVLNPAAPIVQSFRDALLGHALKWSELGAAAAIVSVLFVTGYLFFSRVEGEFADVA